MNDKNCLLAQSDIGKLIKEGYVYKRGDGPIDYSWNKRYFRLFEDKLCYFLDEINKEMRNSYGIKNCCIEDIG